MFIFDLLDEPAHEGQRFLCARTWRCRAQSLEEDLQPLVEFHSSSAYFVSASARVRISFTFHGRPSVFVTLWMRGSQ